MEKWMSSREEVTAFREKHKEALYSNHVKKKILYERLQGSNYFLE